MCQRADSGRAIRAAVASLALAVAAMAGPVDQPRQAKPGEDRRPAVPRDVKASLR